MTMLKYLDSSPRLIDSISYQWGTFAGDKRSNLFTGQMTKDPVALAYFHILESGIANNRLVPVGVKLSMLYILSNRIDKRQAQIVRGARLGLWANVTKQMIVRTDHKFDFRLWLIRANDDSGNTVVGLYKFHQSKRQQDTIKTDEDYLLSEIWVFSPDGKLLSKENK